MPETQVITPQAPPATPPLVTTPIPATPEPDLITKVSQFKRPETPAVPTDPVDIGFDYKELEGIKDPAAKDIAMRAYKSMEAGAQKKFQEAAGIRKSAEQKIQETESKLQEMNKWSPERIQRELNNPDFIQAAQQVAGQSQQNPSGLTNEEYSALSDIEKQKLSMLENKISHLEQINSRAFMAQQHSELRSKYADYNPEQIDGIMNQMMSGKIVATQEHIYKAFLHDEHVKAAYEMGRQEGSKLNQEKLNAFSSEGNMATGTENIPVKEKGESDQTFFGRLAQFRIAQRRKQ